MHSFSPLDLAGFHLTAGRQIYQSSTATRILLQSIKTYEAFPGKTKRAEVVVNSALSDVQAARRT